MSSGPLVHGRREHPLLLLNSAVLTEFGTFAHRRLTLREARALVERRFWLSAIGHEATARAISNLLGIECPSERCEMRQRVGQQALVFRLRRRSPIGVDLSGSELEAVGHEWTLIDRLS
jgi:hypothetical protein